MRRLLFFFAFCLLLICPLPIQAQPPDPFAGLKFLLGTWEAKTAATGSAAATVLGTYTFQTDLGGTVITRTGSLDSCKGPASFDCQHHDSLTIYRDMGDPVLHALYADNEGHVLHYNISTPDATTVVFLTTAPGPKFRLTYHLEGGVMSGKFQMEPPGATEFKSYLEWSGTKR
jgi:hypothetical protein